MLLAGQTPMALDAALVKFRWFVPQEDLHRVAHAVSIAR
jgi:hypothetical protein